MHPVNFRLDGQADHRRHQEGRGTPQQVGGERNPVREPGGSFWAMLTTAARLNCLHWCAIT